MDEATNMIVSNVNKKLAKNNSLCNINRNTKVTISMKEIDNTYIIMHLTN